jgi:hypothetical protein
MSKKQLLALVTMLVLPLLVSCTGSVHLDPRGSIARVTMLDNRLYEGELISADSEKVVLLMDSVRSLRANEIEIVKVDKHHNYAWVPHVLLLNAVNALFLASYVSRAGSRGDIFTPAGIIVGSLMLGIEFASFLTSEPRENYGFPIDPLSLDQLQMEARYTRPLGQVQLDTLKHFYDGR